MQLKIVQTGDPVLRHPARPLSAAELASAEMQQLIELMRETMREAPGVGLAAPQVGLPLQLAVIEDSAEVEAAERKPVPFHVIANPRLSLGPDTVEFFEGCLSVDGFQAIVPRARAVRVEALDHRGQPVTIDAQGWYARILQHEIDHLHGTLYIDRMHTRTFTGARTFARHWAGVPVADVLATLGPPRT
jgi:peptide deformylase